MQYIINRRKEQNFITSNLNQCFSTDGSRQHFLSNFNFTKVTIKKKTNRRRRGVEGTGRHNSHNMIVVTLLHKITITETSLKNCEKIKEI